MTQTKKTTTRLSPNPEEVIQDYRTAYQSRQVSLIGRREVMSGKAKFGIFGAGKELPQLTMARVFQAGDFRTGYYRDQTFMFAADLLSFQEFHSALSWRSSHISSIPSTSTWYSHLSTSC